MKEKENSSSKFALSKKGYAILAIGIVFILLGLYIMPGEAPIDRSEFNAESKFGSQLTWSVILIVLGLLINIFAIFSKEKRS